MTAPAVGDLPFVEDEHGRRYWSVKPSGDYRKDCRQGVLFALAALEYMAVEPEPWLLTHVVGDMPRKEARSGIEVGFLSCVARFAALYRQDHGDDFYRAWMAEGDAAHEAALEAEAKERSEHARHAAQARWAKHREAKRLANGRAA